MADSVQQRLDQMVPALVELQERGIFSQAEVRAVVAKRREFEYKLRRLVARKPDYLRYLAYEINLEALRKIRRQKAKVSGKLPAKKASHEFAGIKHIRSIFERATRRFLADEALWLQYVEWALGAGSAKLASQAVSKALQFHPHSIQLWTKAASFEFFQNGNAQAARVLLQRALRLNQHSSELWLEYYRLEWLYIDKKKAKMKRKEGKEIKGLEVGSLEGEEEKAQSVISTVEETSLDEFCKGAVPLAVFRSCIKTMPSDVELRWRFAEVASNFENSEHVIDEIRKSIVKDFRESPQGWEVLSRFPFLHIDESSSEETSSAVKDAISVFEEGIKQVPSPCSAIWEKYSALLKSLNVEGYSEVLLNLYARADSTGNLSLVLGKEWIELLEQRGHLQQALQVVQKLCSAFKVDPEVWIISAKLYQKYQLFGNEDANSTMNQKTVTSILKKGLDASNKDGAKYSELWHLLIESMYMANASEKKMVKVFQQACAACPNHLVEFGLKYLQWAGVTKGAQGVRTAFQDLESTYLTSDPAMMPVYETAIRSEITQSLSQRAVKETRRLFEKALDKFGAFHTEFWQMYEDMERSLNNHEQANSIRWRAKRVLEDNS